MNHTPFIVVSYAVFFLVLAIDLAVPLVTRRSTLRQVRAQLERARNKSGSNTP